MFAIMKNSLLFRPAFLALAIAFIGFTAPAPAQVPAGVVPRSFEGTGLLTGEIDGEGNVSLHRFDGNGSLESARLPEGLSRAFEASQAGALPAGGVATSPDDPAPVGGLLPAVLHSEQGAGSRRDTVFVLGADGMAVEMHEGAIVTTMDRDANGQLTRLGLPSGHSFELDYDDRGNLVSVHDELHGNTATLAYDSVHDLPVEVHYPGGATERATYDANGNQLSRTSPAGRMTSATYREDSLISGLTSVEGIATFLYYDAAGNLVGLRGGEGVNERAYVFTRDGSGQIVGSDAPEGRGVSYGYFASGGLALFTDADGGQTMLEEDGNGNVTAIVRPGNARHAFSYDGLQRAASYTPPGQSAIHYRYNVHSEPVAISVGGSDVVTADWNDRGQVLATSESTLAITYTYDDILTGQLQQAESSDGIVLTPIYSGQFTTGLAWSGAVQGSFAVNFDQRYRITSNQVNGGSVIAYTYDDDGLVTSAGDLTITRDPASGLSTGTALGVVTESFAYNSFGELVAQSVSVGGTEVFAATHSRDKLGRIVQIIETFSGTTVTIGFTYDAGGRIATVTRNGVMTESYTYDVRGNLISDHLQSYTYNTADQLLTAGPATFTYTATGERLTRTDGTGTTSYRYTALSTLLGVNLADGRSLDYLHDGGGRRAVRVIDGVVQERTLCPDFNVPVATVDAGGSVLRRYVHAIPDEAPAYLVEGGNQYRLITDHVGSVRLVVNTATGAIMQQRAYDVYGRTLSDSAPGFQPFGFAGGWTDPDTALIRFGARDYDPAVRRWTTSDPILFASGSLNNHAYVDSDPVNYVDPSGLHPEDSVAQRELQKLRDIHRLQLQMEQSEAHLSQLVKMKERANALLLPVVQLGGGKGRYERLVSKHIGSEFNSTTAHLQSLQGALEQINVQQVRAIRTIGTGR